MGGPAKKRRRCWGFPTEPSTHGCVMLAKGFARPWRASMTERDREFGEALARLPIPELPETFWEDLGLRCQEALREEVPEAEIRKVRFLGPRGRERAPREPWLAAIRLARFSKLAMVGAITALLVLLASLLPEGFLSPQRAVAAVPVVAFKPDCGSDGN